MSEPKPWAQAWLLKVPQSFPGLLEAWARTMVGLVLVGVEAWAQTLLLKSPQGFPRLLEALARAMVADLGSTGICAYRWCFLFGPKPGTKACF